MFAGESSGVVLTPSGRVVLVQARKLLVQSEQLSETARSALSGTGGSLQIGFVGSATHGLLQTLIPGFPAEYPRVDVILREGTSVGIVEQLEDLTLDIGMVRTPLLQP